MYNFKLNIKKNLYKTYILFLGINLCSCGLLGPDYNKPKIDIPQSWNSNKNIIIDANLQIADTKWWEQFHDPMLNELIKEALNNNNTIQMAIGNIIQAQAILKKVYMTWVPIINMGIGGIDGQANNHVSSINNPALSPFFANQNTINFSSGYANLTPNYSLNIFEIIKNQDLAKLNIQMQKATKNAIRLNVISQVASSYFTLLGLHKKLSLQKQMIADIKKVLDFNKIKFKTGAISHVNVDISQQLLYQLTAQLPAIENNIVETQNALLVLINKNPATIITKNNFDNISINNIIPINLPSTVLNMRPDIIAAEYQVQASNAKIGVATSAFFPKISLTSALGAASYQLSTLINGSTDFWALQIAAAMPLLNLGLYADIDKARGDYYSAYYNYIQTVKNAFSEVDNGLSKYQTTHNIFLNQQLALNASNNIYNLSLIQYKTGENSLSDTINYKINIDYSLLNINQTKIQQLNNIVNLYQVLGGGYNVENTDKAKKFNDRHDE